MQRPPASPVRANNGTAYATADTRLHGRWLIVARVVCAAVVAYALTLFVAGGTVGVIQLRIVCSQACMAGQLTLAQLQSLRHLGLSLDAYVAIAITVILLTSLVWFGAAAVVFWRRSDALFLLLLATQLVTEGAANVAGGLAMSHSAWEGPATTLIGLNAILFCLFLALFPTGQFAPRWMAWVVTPGCVALAAQALPSAPGILGPAVLIVLIAAQVYRYRVVSNGIQRQQTKWIILGIGSSVIVQITVMIPLALVPGLSAPDALYPLLSAMIANLALTLGPIAFVFAVLRYRLYDIDLLIRRTLVYGALTGILATVYFGMVLGVQSVVQTLTGQTGQQPVLIVVSTLLVAALFNPLRRGIQTIIDRRFYRRKYDAARMLAAFGTTLRAETDLDHLSAHLVTVVQETMQSAQVSLWLRQPERHPTDHAHRLEPRRQVPTGPNAD